MQNRSDIKKAVKEHYAGRVNNTGCSCGDGCCSPSGSTVQGFGISNYAREDLESIPKEAAVNSFGCGNPLAFSDIKEGETVLDIGSGAGLDAIIAAKRVGASGMVIGLDMTPEMIRKAEDNVRKAGLDNVRFVLGDAENMPLATESVDWVISNCVINLSPDKEQVFREVYRVLKPGGRILISDIVAENLPQELMESFSAWAGCIAGAIPEREYLAAATKAGLQDVRVLDRVDYDLSIVEPYLKEYFPGKGDVVRATMAEKGTRVSSIRLSAIKPAEII